MAASSRFAVAVHTTALIACCSGDCISSERIAVSVNTNAVVIRRILAQLKKAGIITSAKGKIGGARLARPARKISLFDIFKAVQSESPFAIHAPASKSSCSVARSMKRVLGEVFHDVESSLAKTLKHTSIADIANNCLDCN